MSDFLHGRSFSNLLSDHQTRLTDSHYLASCETGFFAMISNPASNRPNEPVCCYSKSG